MPDLTLLPRSPAVATLVRYLSEGTLRTCLDRLRAPGHLCDLDIIAARI